jgi:hypothetical protein
LASGVGYPLGNPEQPLPDVRRTDARSAQIGGPDGISQCFQVSAYSGEPRPSILARNLLSKDDWRQALGDEPSPNRPDVPIVLDPSTLPGTAEWLAGARASPDRPILWPSGETQGVLPAADAGEEVASGVPSQVVGQDVFNGPLVNSVSHADTFASLSL